MEFEWDTVKNEANKKKHGFGFRDAPQVLEGEHIVFPSPKGEEERWGAIGIINGCHVVVFYTMRGTKHRIISIRRARENEKRKYRELYQSGDSESTE